MTNLAGKRILLGVSGSIAAYKAADLCSKLSQAGADVHVILTANAAKFVGIPTFRALTRNPVVVDLFEEPEADRIAHIELAQRADLVLVAPASANLIAKLAMGIADDMLATCLLATPAATPLLVAPAMNMVMWKHPATAQHVATLKSRGVQVVEPAVGMLACQDIGPGKLADVSEIVEAVSRALLQTEELAGLTVLISAGATREPIDPVRFLSNRSSGRMGYAIAEAALSRGASVTLVSGRSTIPPPRGAQLIQVETADEMYRICTGMRREFDVFVGAAAVADYTPEQTAHQKIKKATGAAGSDGLILRLKRTPDILAAIGAEKETHQIVVGFAAETEDTVRNARLKLASKCADLIVANDVSQEGAGFEGETNIVTFVSQSGHEPLPIMTKREVADQLIDRILELRRRRGLATSGVRS